MPRFAANLSMMFNEHAFLDRFQAAANAGFKAVEYLFPYDFEAEQVAGKLNAAGLKQALFNLPPGDWSKGERGLAALPERKDEFRQSVRKALAYAKIIGAPTLHLMSGLADSADMKAAASYRDCMAFAAELVGADGITLVIEPINSRDMPGYFLNNFDRAGELISGLALPNLKLQFDIYHRQIIHGDVMMGLQKFMPMIGHVQIASVPKRNEPGTGELDDVRVLKHLDALGYQGYVGCEYRPAGETVAGLGWLKSF